MNNQYPRGKINKNDEGKTTVIIKSNKDQNTVIIQYEKPISWLGLSCEEACLLGHALIKTAMEMQNINLGDKQ